ncbi:hypothetical protein KEJ37_07380 [Candidatus Bathyarchaeota archaeon]|nr:hypothetical protein [Candidatus Bathyarchaeota archaeon]
MAFESYVQNLQLEQLFRTLNAPNPEFTYKGSQYFTAEEAEKRDKIILDYLEKMG